MQALNILQNPRLSDDKATKLQVVRSEQLAIDALFLKPGQSHGPARLPEKDRAVVVLGGTGELVLHVDPVDQRIQLSPGMIALAPRATWHAIVNTGHENLVVSLASEFPARVEERG